MTDRIDPRPAIRGSEPPVPRAGLRPLPSTTLLEDALDLLASDEELATLFVERSGELCGAVPRDRLLAVVRGMGERELGRMTLGALLGSPRPGLREVA